MTSRKRGTIEGQRTGDEVQALVEGVDDVVARVVGHHAQFQAGQQLAVVVDLVQREEQRLQRLDPVVGLPRVNNEIRQVARGFSSEE